MKLNNVEAFANSFKALVGIGILSIPSTFVQVGIIGGILGIVVSAFLINVISAQLISSID